jgi:hypothetical protein
MPVSAKFASGKYAFRICDICGVSYRYDEMREMTVRGKRTHLLACPICWDVDHPQNFLPQSLVFDPQALRDPRPDYNYQSRILPHWRPCDSFPMVTALGTVEVTTS